MDSKNSKVRFRYLIEPKFQIWFISYTVIVAASVCFIFFVSFRFFFHAFEDLIRIYPPLMEIGYLPYFQETSNYFWIMFIGVTVATCLTLIPFSLVFSHQIVGPVYKLKTYLRSWADGHPQTPIKFRKKDFFRELEETINDCLSKIK